MSSAHSIKHGIDNILANEFCGLQNTIPSLTIGMRNHSRWEHSCLIRQHEKFFEQHLFNLHNALRANNSDLMKDLSSTQSDDFRKEQLEVPEETSVCIDVESLDECEEQVTRIVNEEASHEDDTSCVDSDSDYGENRKHDHSYKCSSRRLNLVDSQRVTRGSCGEDREFYVLQKEKGKPRGRTVRTSPGIISGTGNKEKRTVGRPVKTPRGRNAKIKRALLIKEGVRIPRKQQKLKTQNSSSCVNYTAVRINS